MSGFKLTPEFSMQRDASFSDDGRYRWQLSRAWDPDLLKPWVCWIMLNPSTADAFVDDPTIRRCISFSKAWGFAGLSVVNLFGFRATSPQDLFLADCPVCPRGHELEYDRLLLGMLEAHTTFVAAWGTHGDYQRRDEHVARLLTKAGAKLQCLGLTAGKFPRHPLYVPKSAGLIPFPGGAA